jgi:hypothetical protein
MADVAKCRADIFRNVADMSSDTSMLHQNCRRRHPTNPTKHMTVLSMCMHRQIFSSIVLLCHSLIVPHRPSQLMIFFQGRFKMSGRRSSSRFVPSTPHGLSSLRNRRISSGSPAGPINIQDHTGDRMLAQHSTVHSGQGLCDIFFAILPLVFFKRVVQLTTNYCYDDWVVQKRKKDYDGNELKAFYFVPVSPLTDGVPTPNRRHRLDNEQVRYQITS